MGSSNLLFESIFNRKVSDEGTRDFLTQITKDYPYFSPAHFFLLSQSEKGTTVYAKQVAKTAILFNNVHWLNFQLEEAKLNTHLSEPIAHQLNDFSNPAPENTWVENNEIIETFDATNSNDTAPGDIIKAPGFIEPTFENSIENKPDFNIPAEPEPVVEENNPASQIPETGFKTIENEFQETTVTETANGFFVTAIPENISVANNEVVETFDIGDSNDRASIDIIELFESIEPGFDTAIENDTDSNMPVEPQPIIQDNMLAAEITEPATANEINGNDDDLRSGDNTAENINSPEAEPEKKATNHTVHFNNDDNPLVNETDEDEIILDEEVEPMKFKLNIDTKNITEDTISFEPLHTSDYFASLGIKLNGEIQPTDKLGKQLKSFTEWLKTMKKIHSEQQSRQTDPAEITVQKLAEISNQEDVVITESMADVLLQQGKRKKAIEVYKKLSLLDSAKSAYFAAKIDQLKEH